VDEDGSGNTEELSASWSQIFLPDAAGKLFARARLEASWRKVPGQPEGEIDATLDWITTKDDPIDDTQRRRMHPQDRASIQVHYIPGSRDPGRQLRNVSGTMLHRLFRALTWSDNSSKAITDAAAAVQDALTKEKGITLLEQAVQAGWESLHSGPKPEVPSFRFVGATLEEVLGAVTVQFAPAPGGGTFGLDRLSEGQASLLYFALVSAVFDFEGALLEAQTTSDPTLLAFKSAASLDELAPPVLTVFAVEEPENHLAPHFLGPIFAALTRFASSRRAQALVASHAPSLLSRVDPTGIRHLRLDKTRQTDVRRLALPDDTDDAFKFVKEAVRAYPELYFARVVVLGEGDSEEVVLPRLCRAHGLDLDRSLLSVAPLGGRFVHHFWRLLSALGIPYVTLLDLDWDRFGGGWGRIKYACTQLIHRGVDPAAMTKNLPRDPQAPAGPIDVATLHTWTDWSIVSPWLERLEEYDVFFSAPLDLDFAMLRALPAAYESLDKTFTWPKKAGEKAALVDRARVAVLKASGGVLGTGYGAGDAERFVRYDRLFLKRGKPVTHMLALEQSTDATLQKDAPPELVRLVRRVEALVR
jgi:putative ATP-dependent endonuclease of OLD family